MPRMKQLFAFFVVLLTSSCKKTIQNIQEDLVIKAMTDGQWAVTNFILNGTTYRRFFFLQIQILQ